MKRLDEVPAYKIAAPLGDYIWNIVIEWDIFLKKTIGDQLVRVIDSIAANIAEEYGRHFKRDKIKFFYYARGSVVEADFWVKKAYLRGLITKEQWDHVMDGLRKLPREINYLIKITDKNLKI